MKRNVSIDIVRGLVMIIMALDHVRDLIHITGVSQNPTDLTVTTAPIFITRWITHLCAPIFVFLSGASVFLSSQRHHDLEKTKKFLLTRGLWLLVLEYTIVNFGLWFDLSFRTLLSQVIAAIGIGFIVLSFLLAVKSRYLGYAGIVIIFLHNLLPGFSFDNGTTLQIIWAIFYKGGILYNGPTRMIFINYPWLPWIGVMLAGYGSGFIFTKEIEKRKKLCLKIGLISILIFIFFRLINIYGDPLPWSAQKNFLFTALSFINVTKYPPSMLYCSITLGIMFLLLWMVDGVQHKFLDFLIVYGRVPLFYYLIHWFVVHSTLLGILFVEGYTWSELNFGKFGLGRPTSGTGGVDLAGVYIIWILIILFMYPLCKWYGNFKANHPEKMWLRYI
ncbi:MAG: heparan-alpha-glucosaminide N-acetyltransferase domain-containing protein [Saprospiraceae bacterium]